MVSIKTVTNADSGTADIVGGDDWDNVASLINANHKDFAFLVTKVGSTYYAVAGTAGSGLLTSGSNATTVTQAAINALTASRTQKETVKVIGTFSLNKITIPSYTILDLSAARLTLNNTIDDHMFVNSDTVGGNTAIEIKGGILDGNKAGQAGAGADADAKNTIHFGNVTDSSVVGTYIDNANNNAIRFKTCTNCSATRNTIKNSRKEGIAIEAGSFNNAVYNYMYNTGWSFLSTFNTSDITVQGNYGNTTNNATSGLSINSLRTNVIGNTLLNCDSIGIPLAQVNTSTWDASNSIISNNIIYNSTSHGISATAFGMTGIKISNNVIYECGQGNASNLAQGIAIAAGNGINASSYDISGNLIHDCQSSGIRLSNVSNGTIKNFNINNNMIYNNAKAVSGTTTIHRQGIVVLGDAAGGSIQYINIQNNRIYDSSTEQGQTYGIKFSNTVDIVIKDNDVHGNVTAGILDGGGNI